MKGIFFLLSKNNLSAKFLLLCWQFWHRDVSAQEYFSTMDSRFPIHGSGCYRSGTFCHRDISAHVDVIFRNVFLPQSIHFVEISEPEYPNGVMSPKSPQAKKSPCQNIHSVEMSICRNVRGAKRSTCQNVHEDEISIPKCLLPKCQVPK